MTKLFGDIPNVYFIKHESQTYRTQQKQKLLDDTIYTELPPKIDRYFAPHYGENELAGSSIVAYFYRVYDIPFHTELEWDLPDFSKEFESFKLDLPKDRKIAIIRPATIRAEWACHTRNPNPNYIAWCCKVLNEAGYYTISIADLEPRKEWLVDNISNSAQLKLHKSELGIYGTLELLKSADVVISGSGFCVPASISAGVNLFTIFGGRQNFDSQYKILHPSMNMKKISWASPINPCRCSLMIHDCNKDIPHLESDFFKFLKEVQ